MNEVRTIADLFSTRLDTLDRLLATGLEHAGGADAFLAERLIADMHPLGTQVAFVCDQPRNFARWLAGREADNIDPVVETVRMARGHIRETKQQLASIEARGLRADKRVHLGSSLFMDLSGRQYVDEFLIPNFYFHLVTAYNILRKSGVPLGKRDYMLHLAPLVRER